MLRSAVGVWVVSGLRELSGLTAVAFSGLVAAADVSGVLLGLGALTVAGGVAGGTGGAAAWLLPVRASLKDGISGVWGYIGYIVS